MRKDISSSVDNLHKILGNHYIKPEAQSSLIFKTGIFRPFPHNRIIFGAPGTGKSYSLKKEMGELLAGNPTNYERVTFHPAYSYGQFVGTYKPVPKFGESGQEEGITYKYVPGPFVRSYVEALKSARSDNPQPFLLIIEEINRAEVAGVFGDVFQLLDRTAGVSDYPIRASEDLKAYLVQELGADEADVSELCLPDNLFIWATMNSADQGVYPMDTAFKRRWNFEYLSLDAGEDNIKGYCFTVAGRTYEWNNLRKALNTVLAEEFKLNEDKLMGPFFIKLDDLKVSRDNYADILRLDHLPGDTRAVAESFISEGRDEYSSLLISEKFIEVFKNKVLMYLFEDAVKQRRGQFFQGRNRYSEICGKFDEIGLEIFANTVSSVYEELNTST